MSQILRSQYIFLDKAELCIERLQSRLQTGDYDMAKTVQGLAQTLTDDLQSVTADLHLRVRPRPREQRQSVSMEERMRQRREDARQRNYGFQKAEILSGNVGYLDLRAFASGPVASRTAHATMGMLANCDAFILDLRMNDGGSPEMVQLLCSYFFAERTLINSLYYRMRDETTDFWTLEDIQGQKIAGVPLFVLTSKRTFSAAEECTYNLKTRRRATIVGENTGGGAHPGGIADLDEWFSVFIPRGRAINPVTRINWEGTGIAPDVAVVANAALRRGISLAQEAATAYRSERGAWVADPLDATEQGFVVALEAFQSDDVGLAKATMQRTLQSARALGVLDRDAYELRGSEYLELGEMEMALETLGFGVATYDQSLDLRMAYAECLQQIGEEEEAAKEYARILDIDPDHKAAAAALRER